MKSLSWFTCLLVLLMSRPGWAISFDDLLNSYGELETLAGRGWIREGGVSGWSESMEGGPATEAELSRPHMAMADVQGNIYIADKDAHAIRKVTPDGTIHTIAGTNESGFNYEAGLGTEVQLNQPNGLYTFPDGTTFILDLGNHRIRKLTTDGLLTTVVEDPWGMTVGRGLWVSPDESTIFYASGTEVRRWTPEGGTEVYAAGFFALGNLSVDPADGQLVATDREGHAVWKVWPDGTRERIAGTGLVNGGGSGRPATETGLKEVRGIYFHPQGGYFLATHDGGQVWFVDDDNIIHLLIDGDDDHTHAGDGLPLASPGKKISEPRAVTLAPNGDLLVTENDFGFVRRVKTLVPLLTAGDFNGDGILDVVDIDQLSAEVRQATHARLFDLNQDQRVDAADRQIWVEDLKKTWFGDSNLDGLFDTGDLVRVFQAGQFEDDTPDNSQWATGDWNGDGDFTSGDFVIAFQAGGFEQGVRSAAAVPEPAATWPVGLLAIWAIRHRRCRRGR